MQNNTGSSFFSRPPANPSNSTGVPLLMNSQNKNNNLKNKNLEYMVNIRRSDRKDIIRNNRFKNVMKITGQEVVNPTTVMTSEGLMMNHSLSGFPPGLSHLEKVKDSQRIYKMLQEIENFEPNIENLKNFIELIKNGDRLQKHQSIIYLRKLLSNQKNLPIQETIDLNGVPLLIEIAKDTSELHLRLEATWCLANLVSGTTQQTMGLINKNIIQIFEEILKDPYNQIVEQAIWGLGNIIGDSVELRNKVVKTNVLNKLILMLRQNRGFNVQKHIIWCISNSLRIRPRNEPYAERKNCVAALISAFQAYNEVDIKQDCLFGVSEYCKTNLLIYFTDEKFMSSLRQYYQYVYQQTVEYSEMKPQISAIHKIIGNITNGDDFDTDKIIDQGYLKDLCIMLCVDDDMCKREICWILSNIAAGTENQIGSLLNEPNLFDNLVNLLYKSKKEIQREALWVICNMTKNCNKNQLNYLIQNNIFSVFKSFLGLDQDMKMVVLILEAIPNMLSRSIDDNSPKDIQSPLIDVMYDCGIADIISELQRHENDIVYEKSLHILETYFELEEY
jgi:hypothetical protein